MANYDAFAKVYDAAMGDAEPKFSQIKTWIRRYHPEAKTVLELACGSGNILRGLADDYEVTGLDLSQPMLAIARSKVPQAKLVHGDMTDFDLRQTFDVVICVFDSINHLPRFDQWTAVLERAEAHLSPGGLFIFDFNTIGRLKRLISWPPHIQHLGQDYLIMTVEAGHNVVSNWNLKIFETAGNGKFTLHEENIIENSFEPDEVLAAVRRRFEILETIEQQYDPATVDADRIHVIARKLGNPGVAMLRRKLLFLVG